MYPSLAAHTLRIGIAITFIWIGIMIYGDPIGWGGYIQPWALPLLPLPLSEMMVSTAFLDIAIGVLLIIDVWTPYMAALATMHLVIVLITSGINAITVRDIGLIGGTLALALITWKKAS